MKIGIIGAIDSEIHYIKTNMLIRYKHTIATQNYYVGSIEGKEIVLSTSGIGKVNAAVCTQILIDHFSVDAIINIGTAGALNGKAQIGDIVISEDTMQYDIDVSYLGYERGQIPYMNKHIFSADIILKDTAKKVADIMRISAKIGRIVSGDTFIGGDSAYKNMSSMAICAEMEGASVAQVAYLNSVPFLIIRIITDGSNQFAYQNYLINKEKFGEKCACFVIKLISNMKN